MGPEGIPFYGSCVRDMEFTVQRIYFRRALIVRAREESPSSEKPKCMRRRPSILLIRVFYIASGTTFLVTGQNV